MILSAVSVWKKFDTSTPLNPSEWEEKEDKAAGIAVLERHLFGT